MIALLPLLLVSFLFPGLSHAKEDSITYERQPVHKEALVSRRGSAPSPGSPSPVFQPIGEDPAHARVVVITNNGRLVYRSGPHIFNPGVYVPYNIGR